MTLIPPARYAEQREAYSYSDSDVGFVIAQTGSLPYVGVFIGIFPSTVPLSRPHGVNMRKFEAICRSVFEDCSAADAAEKWTELHLENLRNATCAIVHWKLASQGNRAPRNVDNVRAKWACGTHKQLLAAYRESDLGKFRIDGVRIPTATAFLRFLYPDKYGVMDKHVVNYHTQPNGITTLRLRAEDGYISDLPSNVEKYYTEYLPFLRAEAIAVNGACATFNDVDAAGDNIVSGFRPCDIEMALFSS